MFKKKISLISLCLLIACLALSACTSNSSGAFEGLPDGYGRADMSGYSTMSDPEHIYISAADPDKFVSDLTDPSVSGVFYIGYPSCPFCNQAVPIMNEVAKAEGKWVRYLDASSVDFSSDIYDRLMEIFEGTSVLDDGEFYVPQMIAIKNGKVVGNHLSLTDDYTTSQGTITASQRKEVASSYQNLFKLVK